MKFDIDEMSMRLLAPVHPDVAIRVLNAYKAMFDKWNVQMRVKEGLRSMERQAELYAQGRTKPGSIVTKAKPGSSIHHYGLAVDSVFVGKDPYLSHADRKKRDLMWREWGILSKAEGLEWGGDFKGLYDAAHTQKLYGLSLDEVKRLYAEGGNTNDLIFKRVDALLAHAH